MGKSSYDLLIQRLDQFIRKFYLNKLIRGLLYSVGLIIAAFLVINILEHYFYFEKGIRKVMFFGFILSSAVALFFWVINPLMKYFSLGRTITHEQAANIIGDHFADVKDKLLNILQLKSQSGSSQINSELIDASINQKTDGLKLVPFKSAIDLSYNKKYAKYALPPFLIFLALIFGAPSLLKDSTHRLINNDREFERAAPFHFKLENDNIEVLRSEDVTITVRVEGSTLPDQVFIDLKDFQYELKMLDRDLYTYTFKNVQKDTKFKVYSGPYYSTEKSIKVLPKPSIDQFALTLDYPGYTGRKDETLNNIGDAFVPQGTRIKWTYQTEDTDEVSIWFNNAKKVAEFKQSRKNTFSHTKTMMSSDLYTVYINNAYLTTPDSSVYNINVAPDNHPSISVEAFADSINTEEVKYFIGNASDDYGLTNLTFNYTVTDQAGRNKTNNRIPIPKAPSNEWTYDYVMDLREYNLDAGDQITYFFEVQDNDGINGSKSSKTQVMTFAKPTIEELEEEEDLNEEQVKDKVEEAIKESKKLKEEIRKMREKLLEKKELSWQEQKELEKLLEKQKEIQEKLKEAQEAFQENLEKQEEFNKPDEETQQKQEKIEEMFEEVIDEEMQTLMEQIQELMQELNKDEMMEQLEEFEMQEEMQEMEMERLEEMFKQLEFEKEMNEMMEKLEELAEKQEELAEETEQKKKTNEELKKEQEKINEEFEKLKEEMEKLAEENEELEFPKPLDKEEIEENSEDVQEQLDDSQEKLEQKENSGASKSQKKAAGEMKKMAGNLQSQMESGEEEAFEEDLKALRQLLENLVTLSYDEETLISDIQTSVTNTPRYVELIQDQFKLKEDFELISDSLYALSKRVDKIESFVTEKLVETERRMEKSIDDLEARKKQEASVSQRRVMTNLNDLALMLAESMDQMQQQMGMSMPGNQQCNKPGGQGQGKPGAKPSDKISEGQQSLGEGLKDMMSKQGKSGKDGNSAKDFAEAAAKQAALRKALEDARKELQEQGEGGQGLQEIIDLMNKIEEDLVNKRLNNDLLKRQQDIETRLLQADKADRKREKDNKRKGETADQIIRELPPNLKEYLKEKESEVELFKQVSPDVYPLYQKMIEGYYNALKGKGE